MPQRRCVRRSRDYPRAPRAGPRTSAPMFIIQCRFVSDHLGIDTLISHLVRDIIEVALRVGGVVVGGGREQLLPQRLNASHGFEPPSST